jgi:hypothetical protein
LIWPDAEPLDLEQCIQRIQKEYPDFPRDEVEEFLLDWIDMGYDPENYSQAHSTSSTASQNGGSPTTFERKRHQKSRRELVTLEHSYYTQDNSRRGSASQEICCPSFPSG